jgi:hypothetical protein
MSGNITDMLQTKGVRFPGTLGELVWVMCENVEHMAQVVIPKDRAKYGAEYKESNFYMNGQYGEAIVICWSSSGLREPVWTSQIRHETASSSEPRRVATQRVSTYNIDKLSALPPDDTTASLRIRSQRPKKNNRSSQLLPVAVDTSLAGAKIREITANEVTQEASSLGSHKEKPKKKNREPQPPPAAVDAEVSLIEEKKAPKMVNDDGCGPKLLPPSAKSFPGRISTRPFAESKQKQPPDHAVIPGTKRNAASLSVRAEAESSCNPLDVEIGDCVRTKYHSEYHTSKKEGSADSHRTPYLPGASEWAVVAGFAIVMKTDKKGTKSTHSPKSGDFWSSLLSSSDTEKPKAVTSVTAKLKLKRALFREFLDVRLHILWRTSQVSEVVSMDEIHRHVRKGETLLLSKHEYEEYQRNLSLIEKRQMVQSNHKTRKKVTKHSSKERRPSSSSDNATAKRNKAGRSDNPVVEGDRTSVVESVVARPGGSFPLVTDGQRAELIAATERLFPTLDPDHTTVHDVIQAVFQTIGISSDSESHKNVVRNCLVRILTGSGQDSDEEETADENEGVRLNSAAPSYQPGNPQDH